MLKGLWSRPSTYIILVSSLAVGSSVTYFTTSHYKNRKINELLTDNRKQEQTFKGSITRLKTEIDGKDLTIDQLKQEVAKLREEDAAEDKGYKDRIAELGGEVQTLRTEKNVLEGRYKKLMEDYVQKGSEIESLGAEIDGYKSRLMEMEKESAELQIEINDLESMYTGLMEEDARKAQELEETRAELEQEIRDYNARVQGLQKENQAIIEAYGLGPNPLDIKELVIEEGGCIWRSNKAEVEQRLGREIADQLLPGGWSRPAGKYLKKKENQISDNFPVQPEGFQKKLENLDVVEPGDKYRVYMGDLEERAAEFE